ncbi:MULTISPECIES: ABC transporter permease [Corallincola]|uniref:ABC transporter permease subunit n=3 Tax=Corallincola TaxID=1775176 RepID=A0A368N0G7_9GAMM|nr:MULTISPECIES: ABC transporter permease subunit [Corallincola]RCU43660.1 ABC transporter permease subunit [Corallincola holothuriorum]TAA42737.1 ABC transporter permease subunit [Corallincola spongiicola]TCI01612.1 ABC transporter permease subunit [Corallincola luteus]
MLTYTLRKMNLFIFTFIGLSLLSFSLIYIVPGDPVYLTTGLDNLTPDQYQKLSSELYFDRPYILQYFHYLGNIFDGNWGRSLTSGENVWDEVKETFPATLELVFYSLVLAMVIGVPIGSLAALKKESITDHTVMTLSLLGISIPVFWWGLLMIMILALGLGLLPISGRLSLLYDIEPVTNFILIDILISDQSYKNEAFKNALAHIIIPTLVLATVPTTQVIRTTRATMLSLLKQNFIKAAQARGISRWRVLRKHALPNSLLPVSRQLGLQISTLMTGAMVTENIFSWPGIGKWLVASLYQRDYPAIQGGLLAVSTFIILATVINDLLHTAADPIARKDYNA